MWVILSYDTLAFENIEVYIELTVKKKKKK